MKQIDFLSSHRKTYKSTPLHEAVSDTYLVSNPDDKMKALYVQLVTSTHSDVFRMRLTEYGVSVLYGEVDYFGRGRYKSNVLEIDIGALEGYLGKSNNDLVLSDLLDTFEKIINDGVYLPRMSWYSSLT